MTTKFKGIVGGVTYTDPALFEKAARDAGHRLGMNRTGDWRVGMSVSVRLREVVRAGWADEYGEPIQGQVWAKGPEPRCGYIVAALDGGRWARIYPSSGVVEEINARGGLLKLKGKVAA